MQVKQAGNKLDKPPAQMGISESARIRKSTLFTISCQPQQIDHNDPIAKSAIPDPDPEPAALELIVGDEP